MIRDVAAQNASLDNDYGPASGPASPGAHWFVPLSAQGVEVLDENGDTVRVLVPNDGTGWPTPASGGAKSTTVTYPAATGAWSEAVARFVLLAADGGSGYWDDGLLAGEVAVTGPGSIEPFVVTVFHNNLGSA